MSVRHAEGGWFDPVPGQVYWVEVDDCCVLATFTAELLVVDEDEDGPLMYFDNGVTLRRGGVFSESVMAMR